ncbi:flavodoxin [Bacillus sp. AGMB 02131]|uniref:Flavodoxin n=1 Tax=Peribacillus faecalis TaxID=2772559 RepID=A0A927CU46_9BACI|nr:flavodoxin domain-containing protein [Peribacillus faecalis]MBD3107491.1 flavodoxin [Peribacillus faecalis]
MNKTAILYHSHHHGNTKKVLDAIAAQEDVDLIELPGGEHTDLSGYDILGFASGTYKGEFHPAVTYFIRQYKPAHGQRAFVLSTHGGKKESAEEEVKELLEQVGLPVIGCWSCRGFDTYGPFKLIGGIAKGHPNQADLEDAVTFFEEVEHH